MSDSTSSSGPDNTQKALITVAVLGGCIVIAFVVAKIVDYCYDRHIAISDDISDISEHTRDLIRSRLAVTAFRAKKNTSDGLPEDSVNPRKIIRIWSARAKESRKIAEQRRAEEQAKRLVLREELIIKVEQASVHSQPFSGHPADTVPSVVIISETASLPSESLAKVDGNAASSNSKTQALPRKTEIKRTLSGLDSSNKIAETPAVVAVSASGNSSVLPGSPSPAKEEQTKARGQNAAGSSQSKTQEPSIQNADGSKSATTTLQGPNSHSAKTVNFSSPLTTAQAPRSPSPSRAPATPSPGPKAPGPKSPAPSPPYGRRTPTPKPPSTPSPPPKTLTSKSPERNIPDSKVPGSRLSGSTSPGPKPVPAWNPGRSRSPALARAPSPAKSPEHTKKATSTSEQKPAEVSSPSSNPPSTTADLPNACPDNSKQETANSSDSSIKSRPTSTLPKQVVTVTETKIPSVTPKTNESKAAATTKQQEKPRSKSNPRSKSFNIKDDPKFSNMPKKLANSMALYGRTSGELDKHKSMVNKRKAAASPPRASNQPASPSPSKPDQSPIVIAAAARKARIKSAKS